MISFAKQIESWNDSRLTGAVESSDIEDERATANKGRKNC